MIISLFTCIWGYGVSFCWNDISSEPERSLSVTSMKTEKGEMINCEMYDRLLKHRSIKKEILRKIKHVNYTVQIVFERKWIFGVRKESRLSR